MLVCPRPCCNCNRQHLLNKCPNLGSALCNTTTPATSKEDTHIAEAGNSEDNDDDKPIDGGNKPIDGGNKPTEDNNKPIENGSKPIEDSNKPIDDSNKPINDKEKDLFVLLDS
jgi:hypothetical protein